MSDKVLVISYHIRELRIRILYICFCLCITFLCAYFFSEQIFYLWAKPLTHSGINEYGLQTKRSFIYTDMTEAFTTYIKISLASTFYLCFPVIAFHIWMFLIPGLYEYEKRRLALCLVSSYTFFSLAMIMAYFFIFPIAWQFFLSFETMNSDDLLGIRLEPKINQYLILITKMVFLLGVSFQFPFYLILLVQTNILPSNWLIRKRNISYLLSFVLAALLSPPDVMSQIILGIPLIVLYEVTIFILTLFEEYRKIS